MNTWFVVLEMGMLNQLLVGPMPSELVTTCRIQPRWSAGQDRSSVFPFVRVAVIFVGYVNGPPAATRSVPSVARVLVFQANPTLGKAGTMLAKAPAYVVAENSLNVSLVLKVAPLTSSLTVPP